ncbi:aminopeptidase [Flavivirga aquatica]|uniref:Aminopeptidase N n=1 Tax=Flavivirga aquatica TaxID=1849968 RepID=A0A1E5TBC6_9FLAO|nr:M1 family metallopeptidase [Flavivirga aquatica]OEK08660.1 aminopeptidase [Flavivirga aquatica]
MRYLLVILTIFLCWSVKGQQRNFVDFKTAKAAIVFGDLKKKEVFGVISYTFKVLKDVDSVFVDAKGFQNIESILDGQFSDNIYNGKQLIIKHGFKANSKHTLEITWKTNPRKAMYFIGWNNDGQNQIWTQGQGKYTSNWLPSFDDMGEKVVFDLNITFDKAYEVVANGKLVEKNTKGNLTTWCYNMNHPMSSYLVALAIGKYNKKKAISKSNIPLEMYYYPKDSLKFEPTYRYTKRMFDFLEDEIGVSYPWQNYKQVPVKDFLYAGMENTSTTIFSDAFVIDSIAFIDKNYVNINAHELVHQWFGNLITETSGTHHWLQEGFATYYALLSEKEVFGENYYYWRLYEYAQELLEQDKAGGSTSLLDPKSSSITFYKKGAWVLYMLREHVGTSNFKTAIKNYLSKYKFKNVETKNFINEIEQVSGMNLEGFVKKWIKSKSLEYKEMESHLYSVSNDIRDYSKINCDLDCYKLFRKTKSEKQKQKIVRESQDAMYSEIKNTKNLKVRQTMAQKASNDLKKYKIDYESFLNDKSYLTIEATLFTLWSSFPIDREKYLKQTKGIQGFNDKNLRILWLTLALVTEGFELENKKQYFNELIDYTDFKYGFEVRQKAFQYLSEIGACNNICIKNLEQATTHHSWQFSKFAKLLIKRLKT